MHFGLLQNDVEKKQNKNDANFRFNGNLWSLLYVHNHSPPRDLLSRHVRHHYLLLWQNQLMLQLLPWQNAISSILVVIQSEISICNRRCWRRWTHCRNWWWRWQVGGISGLVIVMLFNVGTDVGCWFVNVRVNIVKIALGFVVFQDLLHRHVWQRVSELLPEQPVSPM